jgi:hypothetical protein
MNLILGFIDAIEEVSMGPESKLYKRRLRAIFQQEK